MLGKRLVDGEAQPGVLPCLWLAFRVVVPAAPAQLGAAVLLRAVVAVSPAVVLGALGRLVDGAQARGGLATGPLATLGIGLAAGHLATHLLGAFPLLLTFQPKISRWYHHHLAKAHPARFDDPEFQTLLQQAGNGVGRATNSVVSLLDLLQGAALSAGMLTLLGTVDPVLVAVALAGAIPVVVVTHQEAKDSAEVWMADTGIAGRQRGYLFQLTADPVAGDEIRALGLRETLLGRLREAVGERLVAFLGLARRARRRGLVAAGAHGVATLACLAVIVARALAGPSTPGGLAAAAGAVLALSAAVAGLLRDVTLFVTSAQYLRSPLEVERLVAGDELRGGRDVRPGPLAVELRQVSFAYPADDGHAVLEDLSLSVRGGELLALVGENGAGKSTLTRLAMGVLHPTSGTALVQGIMTGDVDRRALWDRIGFLPQGPLRLEIPLREAVGVAARGGQATDDQIRSALVRVGAGDVLDDIGLDGAVGRAWDDGHDLSGGQWQRVALARLALRRADLWILDEPTANLDPLAERDFVDGLRDLLGGSTCIFVSHRFSTVRAADRIAVLSDGAVAELGSHEELLAAGGIYARMFTLQAAGYR